MTDSPHQTRRRFLTLAGSAFLVGSAGCVGSRDGQGGAGQDPSGAGTDTTTGDGSDHGGDDHGGDDHHDETTETTTETTTTDDHAHHQHHDGHHHEEVPHEPADHVEVKMVTTDDGYHFSPHLAWVKPGGTVTWVNESGDHTATAYAPANDKPRRIPEDAAAWDSGLFTEQGKTFEMTFEVEGVYDYYCAPHEGLGMLGTVLVGEPEPHGQPGMTSPESSLPSKARSKIQDLNGMVDEALGHHQDEGSRSEHDEGTETDDHGGNESDHHGGNESDHDDGTETDHGGNESDHHG